MAKVQTDAEWLSDLHVGGVRLLQTDQQGDRVQTAPFCDAVKSPKEQS